MTSTAYKVIEVFTSEEARWRGSPLYDAIVHAIAKEGIKARCVASRGIGGCYETGEVASHHVLDLSNNMPVKIEIVLPASELEAVVDRIEEMVSDGVVAVHDLQVRSHRMHGRSYPAAD